MVKLIISLAKLNKISHYHPVEKLMISIIPIIIIGFCNTTFPIIANILVFLILHVICENNKKVVTKYILAVAAFTSFSSITLVFDYGIEYILIIFLRGLSSGLCLSFLAITTPIDDILFMLSKNSWLKDMCDIAKTMERFLIVIYDEYYILYKSMKSRGGFQGVKNTIINTGKMAGLLFLNTMKRWKDIKESIASRGYRGYIPYLKKEFSFSVVRILGIGSYILILGVSVYRVN